MLVFVDESGDPGLKLEQGSRGNNLLQLADYVAGVIHRSVRHHKKYADDYRKMIGHREIYVQIWPK